MRSPQTPIKDPTRMLPKQHTAIKLQWLGLFYCLIATCSARAEDLVRLTHDSLFKRDPVFIARGEELVYVVLDRPEQLRLMRLKLVDRTVHPLHKDEMRSELEPAFSSDGRYYVFLQNRGAASVAMVIRDLQTNEYAEIPPAPGFAGMRSPAFSPDAKRLIYSFAEHGRQQIYSVNTKGKDPKTLIDSTGINNWPSYSPDGQRILFGSTRHGNFDIYVVNRDGSNICRVTNLPCQDIRPRFSPNGKRIAFTSNRDGNYEIYVMNVDGTGLFRLTENPEKDDYPAWHPDGKRLVIVSERTGRQDLYLVQVPTHVP